MDKWSIFKYLLRARDNNIDYVIKEAYDKTIKEIINYSFAVSANHDNVKEIVDLVGDYIKEQVAEIEPQLNIVRFANLMPTPEVCSIVGTAKALCDALKHYIEYKEQNMLVIK